MQHVEQFIDGGLEAVGMARNKGKEEALHRVITSEMLLGRELMGMDA